MREKVVDGLLAGDESFELGKQDEAYGLHVPAGIPTATVLSDGREVLLQSAVDSLSASLSYFGKLYDEMRGMVDVQEEQKALYSQQQQLSSSQTPASPQEGVNLESDEDYDLLHQTWRQQFSRQNQAIFEVLSKEKPTIESHLRQLDRNVGLVRSVLEDHAEHPQRSNALLTPAVMAYLQAPVNSARFYAKWVETLKTFMILTLRTDGDEASSYEVLHQSFADGQAPAHYGKIDALFGSNEHLSGCDRRASLASNGDSGLSSNGGNGGARRRSRKSKDGVDVRSQTSSAYLSDSDQRLRLRDCDYAGGRGMGHAQGHTHARVVKVQSSGAKKKHTAPRGLVRYDPAALEQKLVSVCHELMKERKRLWEDSQILPDGRKTEAGGRGSGLLAFLCAIFSCDCSSASAKYPTSALLEQLLTDLADVRTDILDCGSQDYLFAAVADVTMAGMDPEKVRSGCEVDMYRRELLRLEELILDAAGMLGLHELGEVKGTLATLGVVKKVLNATHKLLLARIEEFQACPALLRVATPKLSNSAPAFVTIRHYQDLFVLCEAHLETVQNTEGRLQ
ncbi:hypothetical protein DIPPA_21627 [Diplonema papillatum]|nr:hypothetical protein DIPPA_21627 [Diplonema papillatum]|eukprot:gene13438-20698_t